MGILKTLSNLKINNKQTGIQLDYWNFGRIVKDDKTNNCLIVSMDGFTNYSNKELGHASLASGTICFDGNNYPYGLSSTHVINFHSELVSTDYGVNIYDIDFNAKFGEYGAVDGDKIILNVPEDLNIKQQTEIIATDNDINNYSGYHFPLYEGTTRNDIWLDISGSDTEPSGLVNSVRCDISTANDSDEIANLLNITVNGMSGFSSTINGSEIIVTNDIAQETTNSTNTNSSNLTINTLKNGSGGFLPSNLVLQKPYWIRFESTTKARLYNSRNDALTASNPIDIGSDIIENVNIQKAPFDYKSMIYDLIALGSDTGTIKIQGHGAFDLSDGFPN